MIIYEVSLEVQIHVFDDFYQWLLEHVKTMLTFSGFQQAEIKEEVFASENICHWKNITVSYYLNSEKDLEHYFNHHAAYMRADAEALFKDQFTARRTILRPLKNLYKK